MRETLLLAPPLDFESLLKEKRQQHFSGTREWLFDKLFEWLDDPHGARISWLKGSGGTGKSVVAAVFLERLLRHRRADDASPNYVAAWHLCRHDDADRSDPLRLVMSLAAMLGERLPGFRNALDESATRDALSDATSRPDKAFEALLSDPLAKLCNNKNDSSSSSNNTPKVVVIVIDALDELPRGNRAALLRMLKDGLGKLPADRVRVFVTSRDEPDIRATFNPFDPLELRVDEERNQQDVRACVEHVVTLYVRELVTAGDLEKEVARKFRIHIKGTLEKLKPLMDQSLRIYEKAVESYLGGDDADQSFAAVADVKAFEPSQQLLQESDDFEVNFRKAKEAQGVLEGILGSQWAHKDGETSVKRPLQPEDWVDDAISPGVKSEASARRKLENNLGGHANGLTDLARITLVAKSPRRLLHMLDKLKELAHVVLLKNRFAKPTPIGYRDLKTLIKLPLRSGGSFLCEVQLNLESVLKAKGRAHEIYEDIRTALPDILRGAGLDPQKAGELERFLIDRLNNSALDSTIAAMLEQASGLMLYVRLAADHLEHLQAAKHGAAARRTLTFEDVLALPRGLDDMYEENLRRAFPGGAEDPSWIEVQPFVEVLMVAREPPHRELLRNVLGWSEEGLKTALAATSLVFPVVDDRVHFLHKTIYDYLCSGRGEFSITAGQLAAAETTLRDACSRLLEPLIDGRMDSAFFSSCVKTRYALRHAVAHAAKVPTGATLPVGRVVRSLRFHLAAAKAGLCGRLIHDLIALAAACDEKSDGGDLFAVLAKTAREWARFVRQYNREFTEDPAFVYQAAANWPDATEPYRAFVEEGSAAGIPVVAVERLLGKPQRLDPCLLVLRGHSSAAIRCAFSPPSGKRIVTASMDGTARVWEVETGALLLTYDGHSDGVSRCAFSPDGERVVTGGEDKAARVWVAATGETLLVLEGHTELVTSCTFSPDGALIATSCGDKTARLWDAETGRQVRVLEGHSSYVHCCAFSPNGELVATASSDKTVRVWTVVATGSAAPRVIQGHSNGVTCCSFSPDGERLVTASADMTARTWLVQTGVWLRVLKGHTHEVCSCAFSPAGERVVTASLDYSVRLWNGETGAPLGVLNGHTRSAFGCAFSPSGKLIASASGDETVRIWDADAPDEAPPESEVERSFTSFTCESVAMSPDGKRIVTAAHKERVARVWDAETGAVQLELKGHTRYVYSCAFSSSGKLIATASGDGTVRLWRAKTGAELRVFPGRHRSVSCCFFRRPSRVDGGVRCCAFSPDDKLVVSGNDDRTARLWDVKRGHELKRLDGHTSGVSSCAFSPKNGQLVATCSRDKTARLWVVATGAVRHTLEGHTGVVWSCAFSPSGDLLATASFDKTVRLWRVETGALQRALSGHTFGVSGCAFSSDGEWVVTASFGDQTARVWDAATFEQLVVYTAGSRVACIAASSKSRGRFVIGTEEHGFHALMVHARRSPRT